MATLQAVIKEREIRKDLKVNIKIRVTHNRKCAYIKTNFYVLPEEFDNGYGKVKKKNPNHEYLNLELQTQILDLQRKLLKINNNINQMAIGQLVDFLKIEKEDEDFLKAMDDYIILLKNGNQDKTASVYKTTRNKLDKYKKHSTLTFSEIDSNFLVNYRNSELNRIIQGKDRKGMKINSIAVDFRNIRRIFNWKEKTGLEYPFRKFKIEQEQTPKRNISIGNLKALKEVELIGMEGYMRDMFFLIFYLIGINIKDLYNLKKSDLVDGRIHYKRAKTSKLYSIKIYPEAMKIINSYAGAELLLNSNEFYANHDNFKKAMIKFMNRITKKLGIPQHITSYYARHSWATIASSIGIEEDIIAHALGHEYGNPVTSIYIDFDLKKVDNANELVINSLN